MNKASLIGLYEISLDGSKVQYRLKKSLRARRMRLEINYNTGLSVVVPRRYDIAVVEKFISLKRDWILRKLRDVQVYKTITDNGKPDTVSYIGKTLRLNELRGKQEYAMVNLTNDEIIVSSPDGKNILKVLKNWYLQEADRVVKEKVDYFGKLIGVSYNNLAIKAVKTRWGSCSRSGNLSFNWKLIMAPETVIDYVVIHELCHLKRMDHSKLFWKLVETYAPAYRIHRNWLKQHEAEMNRQWFD